MAYPSSTQYTHDRINLVSLVRKLEVAIASGDWANAAGRPSSSKVQGARQKVRHATKLLNNVKEHEAQHSSQPETYAYLNDVQSTLDRLSAIVQDAQTRIPTASIRPAPILPTLPPPTAPAPPPLTAHKSSLSVHVTSPGAGDVPAPLATNLLLGPDESDLATSVPLTSGILDFGPNQPLSPEPLTSASPPAAPLPVPGALEDTPAQKPSGTQPAFLQNSQAVQDELSAQLAAMATQLKRNALHFAKTLDADKDLVASAGEKVERNLEVISQQRVRVRDRGVAARGSTCFVVMAVVVVVVAFALMVLVIRVT